MRMLGVLNAVGTKKEIREEMMGSGDWDWGIGERCYSHVRSCSSSKLYRGKRTPESKDGRLYLSPRPDTRDSHPARLVEFGKSTLRYYTHRRSRAHARSDTRLISRHRRNEDGSVPKLAVVSLVLFRVAVDTTNREESINRPTIARL
jgi:hypothetical protein